MFHRHLPGTHTLRTCRLGPYWNRSTAGKVVNQGEWLLNDGRNIAEKLETRIVETVSKIGNQVYQPKVVE